MLRECFRHEALASIVMHSDDFYLFFEYVEVPTFDISSDAFSTFKVLSCYIHVYVDLTDLRNFLLSAVHKLQITLSHQSAHCLINFGFSHFH